MIKNISIVIIFSSLLSSCGWQLRGLDSEAISIQQLQLQAKDSYTPLYRTFQHEMDKRGIEQSENEVLYG